jgi:putative flavoprotein involved in K+ transport
MSVEHVDTLVIGAGQAGIAASEHLGARGIPHLVLEKSRIAESWRTARWDSLVANGPAWHDRFPNMDFPNHGPDEFVPKEQVADYFVAYAEKIGSPVRCGVEVKSITRDGDDFLVETSEGSIRAANVISATGAFQKPVIPTVVPADTGIHQIHSHAYRNPAQMPEGAVLVVGAGSSGTQIADELLRSGRQVYLSIGPHDRPPRRYRGHDFVWWLGALGIWDLKVPAPNTEHVTIAVSGAYGGNTVDFRRLAARGMNLLGRAGAYKDGVLSIEADLADNIARGDENYLALLKRADDYAAANGLDLPEEPEAHVLDADPDCVTNPTLSLDLKAAGITAIIWATGYSQDFSWIKLDTFDEKGRPVHERGVSNVPGLYFIGLPWLSRRASSFIWGCWHDADYLAGHIAARRQPETLAASAG